MSKDCTAGENSLKPSKDYKDTDFFDAKKTDFHHSQSKVKTTILNSAKRNYMNARKTKDSATKAIISGSAIINNYKI